MLVEGSPRNFAALRDNLAEYLSPSGGKRATVTAVNALVGMKRGNFAKIVDETGWWDGTEAKVVPCSAGSGDADCKEIRLAEDLFLENSVPKTFAVLTMDMEMRDVHYESTLKNLVRQGYRPVYIIVELNPMWNKKVFRGLGYESLGRWHYDEVFYYKAAAR